MIVSERLLSLGFAASPPTTMAFLKGGPDDAFTPRQGRAPAAGSTRHCGGAGDALHHASSRRIYARAGACIDIAYLYRAPAGRDPARTETHGTLVGSLRDRARAGPVALPQAAGRDGAGARARRGHDLARRRRCGSFPSCPPTTSTGRCTCRATGWIDPSGSTTELARRARTLGVAVETGVRVTGIERARDGAVAAVVTDRGRVRGARS